MIKEIKYSGIADRQVKVEENEALGLTMLRDIFDNPGWKHGDSIVGTMTFTDEPQPVIILPPIRDLLAEIDSMKSDIKAIKAKVGL